MRDRKVNKTRDQEADRPYELIHILSDINRMQILRLLADRGELCARDILANFPITQPTLSHHMSVLIENNLVESRKSGRWVFYSVSKSGIQEVIDFFETIKNSVLNPIEKVTEKPDSANSLRKVSPSQENNLRKPLSKKLRDERPDDRQIADKSSVDDTSSAGRLSDVSSDKKDKKKDKNKDKPGKKDKKKKKGKKK